MHRLLADANFPRPTVLKLRRLGYDVKTVQEIQGTSRPEPSLTDDQVLECAIREKRAVITINSKHFRKLHAQRPQHKGIIVCKENLYFKKHAKEIDAAIKEYTSLFGKLIEVPWAESDDS